MNRSYTHLLAVALFVICGVLIPAGSASAIYVQYFQWGNGATTQAIRPGGSAIIRAHCQDQDGYKIYNYPVYSGYPDPFQWGGGSNDVTIQITPAAGTYQYWFACQDNQFTGYERSYAGPITLHVTDSTMVTSFRASPTTVASGGRTTLSWDGSRGVRFSSCQLKGGQWGTAGAWFTALPGSIQTDPIAAETTYSLNCFDTDGANTGERITTVSLRDQCSNIPGTQATVPANAVVYGGGGFGDFWFPGMCLCSAGYTLQGEFCVGSDACSNIAGTQTGPPANGTLNANGTCSCNAGYSLNGSGACVASCTGANQVGSPPNCTCDTGYSMQNGSCVAVSCPGPNETNWPTCSCAAGYSRDSGTNMCIRQVTLNITVNGQAATRVQRGNTVALAWSATGVVAGSCRITNNSGATIASTESGTATPAIANQTIFRLACQNDAGTTVAREASVTLIPSVIEE